jgi:hypothetical protein
MTDKSTKLWLTIITILLGANILATCYIFYNKNNSSANAPILNAPKISNKVAMDFAKPIITLYNSGSHKDMYMQFDELARVQLQEDIVTAEMEKLKNLMGSINEYVYDRAELAGNQNGQDVYNLYYKVKLNNKDFKIGELKITVLKKEDGYGLFGFFVNGKTGAFN